jgi:hypothetical protein
MAQLEGTTWHTGFGQCWLGQKNLRSVGIEPLHGKWTTPNVLATRATMFLV